MLERSQQLQRSVVAEAQVRQSRLYDIDQALTRETEAIARCIADGGPVDVSTITALRVERAVVTDELRVLMRAEAIAGVARRDAEQAEREAQRAVGGVPQQTIGGTLWPGRRAVIP